MIEIKAEVLFFPTFARYNEQKYIFRYFFPFKMII